MKILQASAAAVRPIQVRSFYSGNSGFYCCMFPTNETLTRLQQHFAQVPQLATCLVPPALQHVTIMHSVHSIPLERLPWINRDTVLRGSAIGFDLFIKPHKTTGAVVMLLESTDLEEYHEQLKTMAEYSWDDYKPHLTIAYDQTPTEAAILIAALTAMPLPKDLTFTAPIFEDKS